MDEDRKLYGGPFPLLGEGRGGQLGAGPAREAWLREERGGASARGAWSAPIGLIENERGSISRGRGFHVEGRVLFERGVAPVSKMRGLFHKGAWLQFGGGVAPISQMCGLF